VKVRIPARLAAPLRKSARNASMFGSAVVVGLLGILVTSRWFPASTPVVIWWPYEVAGWLVVLLAGALTFDSVRAWLQPSLHRAILRLEEHGNTDQIINDLRVELDGPTEQHGAATFTTRYMLVETWSTFAILPIERIAWCYSLETLHRKYGVQIHRSFRVYVALRGGEMYDFASTASEHENVLLCIAQRPGHHVIGFDESLEKIWKIEPVVLTRGIDLLGREGRLHEGPVAVVDAVKRADATVEADARAAVVKARALVARVRAEQSERDR
jgi:hypothetical protein